MRTKLFTLMSISIKKKKNRHSNNNEQTWSKLVWDPKEAMLVSGAHEMNGPLDPGGPTRRPTCFKDLRMLKTLELITIIITTIIIMGTYIVHICTWPHCIKLFAGVFYGKNQETPAKKCFHCNLHRDLPEFFYSKKKVWQKVLCNGALKECSRCWFTTLLLPRSLDLVT